MEEPTKKPHVKLVGENGNVFNVIGLCRRSAMKAGWSTVQWHAFRDRLLDQKSYDDVLCLIMSTFEVE